MNPSNPEHTPSTEPDELSDVELEKDLGKTALEAILPPPPEGYKTTGDIAADLEGKVSQSTIMRAAKNKLSIEGTEYRRRDDKGSVIYYSPAEIEEIINHPDIQELLSLDKAPEGYKTAPDIETDLGGKVSGTLIRKTIKNLGIKGTKFRKNGKKRAIFYSPAEIEEIINHPDIQKPLSLDEAPEGWFTIYGLIEKLEISNDTIKKAIAGDENSPPIEERKYKNEQGRPLSHYPLAEVAKRVGHLTSAEPAPEGWFTIYGLAQELGLATKTIQKAIVDEKLGLPPIETKEYKDKAGHLLSHYPLAEVAKRVGHLTSAEPALEGWFTIGGLVKELRFSNKVIQEAIAGDENFPPIKGIEYKDKSGRLFPHYPLAEVKKRVEHLVSAESAPEGYKTAGDISSKGGLKGKISHDTITYIATKLGIKGTKFRKNGKKRAIFYSPAEIEEIINHPDIQELLSLDKAPEGWFTVRGLIKKLGLSDKVIQKAIAGDENSPPIEGRKYKDRNSHLRTHYPLAEVAKRVGHLTSAEPAPEGWFTIYGLTKELELSKSPIKKAIAGDENFPPIKGIEYKDKSGRLFPHYPLAEVAKRVGHLTSAEPAPEGWFTVKGLVKELELSQDAIQRAIDRTPVKGTEYKHSSGAIYTFYSPEEQAEIYEEIENSTHGTSFPEQATAFYLQQAGIKIQQGIRPDWMKNPSTNYNLEVDIFIPFDNPPPLGIGIEYDGERWHKNPDYDAKKNRLSRKNGYVEIIHIREQGCPELPNDIPCITRQNNTRNDLAESIGQLFTMLSIPLPETGIDIKRDSKAINALMRKDIVTQEFDSAKSLDELSVAA